MSRSIAEPLVAHGERISLNVGDTVVVESDLVLASFTPTRMYTICCSDCVNVGTVNSRKSIPSGLLNFNLVTILKRIIKVDELLI